MTHYDAPFVLGNHLRDIRDGYCRRAWEAKYCCIGWHDNVVRIASDDGAIDFTFHPNGHISRSTHGGFNKFQEFVASDIQPFIDWHNEALKSEAVA